MPDRPDPKAIAAARRRRAHTLRRRIAIGATTAFLALFGGITVQMATGHDPVLLASKRTATTTSASTPSTATAGGDDGSSATGSSTSSQSSSPSAVITSQS